MVNQSFPQQLRNYICFFFRRSFEMHFRPSNADMESCARDWTGDYIEISEITGSGIRRNGSENRDPDGVN